MNSSCVESASVHTTDALPHEASKVNERIVSDKVLAELEQDLDEFEKVSLLFLIAADEPDAREDALEACTNIGDEAKLLSEFLKKDANRRSQKLLEAISVVNNREVLRKLGFSPNATARKYLRIVPRYTADIHPAAKVLYSLFESLNAKEAKSLFSRVYKDGVERCCQDEDYLELHALHWLRAKYIEISPERNDLSRLRVHLKNMGYCDEPIYHDLEYFSSIQDQSDTCVEQSPSARTEIRKDEIPMDARTRFSPEKHYIQRGKCVIINEENFLENAGNKYEKREGTKKDAENLQRTFTGLGFDVEELEDLTEDEIFKELARLSENFDKNVYDCLVVVILSHGYEGGIVSSDCKEISINDIDDAMCVWQLREVVKILIVQACQGKIIGDVSPNSGLALDGPGGKYGQNPEGILRRRHFARFMSTMNGFSAIRHKAKGSWFILAVCEVLREGDGISVLEWQTQVIGRTRSKFGHVNNCRLASQLPEFTTRLETDVIFPPYEEKPVSRNKRVPR